MPNRIVIFHTCLFLALFNCDSSQVFDAYQTVPNQWHKDEVIIFNFQSPDSINPHNLFINLRNNNDYRFSNLHLIVEMDYPNGKVIRDTLEYQMANADGSFLGEGFTDLKENKLWFKENLIFKESGTHEIKIKHAMRENGRVSGVENLEGITEIGFRVERSQTQN